MGRVLHSKLSIGTRTLILSKTRRYILWVSVIGILVGSVFMFVRKELGLNGDYVYYIFNRPNNLHISKDGKIIIKATIVDLHHISGYYVGLRLPAEYYECDEGGSYKVRIRNEKRYFILSTDTGTVFDYGSQTEFVDKLKELEIDTTVNLDYSQFKTSWKYLSPSYKDTYWASCKEIAR